MQELALTQFQSQTKSHLDILLVDDDLVDREAVKRALMSDNLSHSIIEVLGVDEALEEIRNTSFDVILLDYRLPRRDGIELLYELSEQADFKKPAIIMMSTTNDEQIIGQCLQAGAHDFVLKSALNPMALRRSMINAQIRSSLESQLQDTYMKLKHIAEQDYLTGFANRYSFDKQLKSVFHKQFTETRPLTLMLINLDHFKVVNDSYGHDLGDQLLCRFTQRIKKLIETQTFVARVGGDEFGIIITGENSHDRATDLAQRIIVSTAKPYDLDGFVESVTVSIGIATVPNTTKKVRAVFKHADMAVHAAKKNGRNQFLTFQKWMKDDIVKKSKTIKDMQAAVDNGEFKLKYQPIFDAFDNRKILGFEALLRWPVKKNLTTEQVIVLAEESKLIKAIGRWVIKTAMQQLSNWSQKVPQVLKMSINLSAVQLEDFQLIEWITDCLDEYNITPQQLEFELTETALFDDAQTNIEVLQELVKMGVTLSLDDFGTGFSSITHLKNFPISTVKIDKSLLPVKMDDTNSYRLFKGLCHLIKSMDKNITAEGVENASQLRMCQELGVNNIQGFYLAKPASRQGIEKKYFPD